MFDPKPTDDNYKDWLEETGLQDTTENRGWFECSDEDRSTYINEHPDWWKDF